MAAALEEPSYEVNELVYDLANLRAGHRFEDFESFSSRLGNCCRLVYGNATFEGYLDKGLPLDYGDGAAEVIARYEAYEESGLKSGEGSLQDGDIERVRLEWVSLLRNIALAPDFAWGRWRSLQSEAENFSGAGRSIPFFIRCPSSLRPNENAGSTACAFELPVLRFPAPPQVESRAISVAGAGICHRIEWTNAGPSPRLVSPILKSPSMVSLLKKYTRWAPYPVAGRGG